MTRQEIIDFCLTCPAAYEDYPFDDSTDPGAWTAMRHRTNKKTFTFIAVHSGQLIANLKCDPAEADFLRQMYESVTPGYHMNKTHWNTVVVDGDVPEDELKRMIEKSYDLIKPKMRKRKMKLIVNKDKCPHDHKCPSIPVCPKGAISQADIYSLPEIDGNKCVVCGKCMKFCPKGAFEKS